MRACVCACVRACFYCAHEVVFQSVFENVLLCFVFARARNNFCVFLFASFSY